jgi:SAM-dependent methyltransferase
MSEPSVDAVRARRWLGPFARRLRGGVQRRLRPDRLRRHWRLGVVKTHFGVELVRNYAIDHRYGGSCAGSSRTVFPELGAYGTSSVDYWQLRQIFSAANGLEVVPRDVLVDVGCGKGRVLNHWLELGLGNRIVGIELDERYASFARRRLSGYQNVEVICADAIVALPPEGTLLFLFNPFGAEALARFKERVVTLFEPGRRLTIVYYFAMHAHVFERDPRFVVEPFAVRTFHPGVTVRLAR